MNRHDRLTAEKQGHTPGPTTATPGNAGAATRPSLALRIVSKALLAKWVLDRVHHPDLIAILIQVAHQVGRADAIARLTVKLSAPPR